ncbi:hypothetical protein ABSA28_00298 [Candidatus Hepatincolaceae symbiont of Richtersius coronifer]
MNNLKRCKYCILIIALLLSWGCFNDNLKTIDTKTSFKTIIVSENPLSSEYFLQNYSKDKLALYDKEQTLSVYNQLLQNPTQIQRLSKSDIFNLLGAPNLIKSENFLELWQYRSDYCILNIAWNSNISDYVYSTKSYDFKLAKVELKGCLVAVVNYSKKNNR